MTQQQPNEAFNAAGELIIAEAWQLPAHKDESITAFVRRVLKRGDWFAGDTITIVGEYGRMTLASGEENADGDLVELQPSTAGQLLTMLGRLLSFGFGRISLRITADGGLQLTELQLQLRPDTDAMNVQAFLAGLKRDVLPRVRQAYGAWWTPLRQQLTVRYHKDTGALEAGHLTMSI